MGTNQDNTGKQSSEDKRLREKVKEVIKDLLEEKRPPFTAKIKREDKDIVRVLAILYGFFLVVMPYIPLSFSTLFNLLVTIHPISAVTLTATLIFFPVMAFSMGIEIS